MEGGRLPLDEVNLGRLSGRQHLQRGLPEEEEQGRPGKPNKFSLFREQKEGWCDLQVVS